MTLYTNRSRIQDFQWCPRLGFLHYHWGGRGLSPRRLSIYLGTGSYVHKGIALLLKLVKECQDAGQPIRVTMAALDTVCTSVVSSYKAELEGRGVSLNPDETTEAEQYYIAEQTALVEAQVRAFAYRVLPQVAKLYWVRAVEEELPPQKLCESDQGPVEMESRSDSILELKSTPAHIEILSLKTAGTYRKRQDDANAHDLQGLCETWAYERQMAQQEKPILEAMNAVHQLTCDITDEHDRPLAKSSRSFFEFLKHHLGPDRIAGVLMVFLLKGKRVFVETGQTEDGDPLGYYETASPLVRGWRKWDPVLGWQYAHSWYYPNPENKSGKSSLGKGWEMFRAWELPGGIKEWIKLLASGKVQPECGDVLGKQFVVPQTYYRKDTHVQGFVRQAVAQERDWANRLAYQPSSGLGLAVYLDANFAQHRSHCHEHFGGNCPFVPMCYNPQVFADPLGSGLYEWRTPHHAAELAQFEKEKENGKSL